MITRVLDERGQVLHDCEREGCAVAWDGTAIENLSVEILYPDAASRPPNAVGVKVGEKLPGAQAPDPTRWTISGTTARLKVNG